MTVKHLFGREDVYLIHVERGVRSHFVSLHTPKAEASAEWKLGGRGFGVGFTLGRNGGESDLGLDIYAGRLASLWLRLRAPWTKWARVDQASGDPDWYYARHTGVRLFPHEGCFLRVEVEARDGRSSRSDPWWREMRVGKTQILGRTRHEREVVETGETVVPMPEGNYAATWKRERWTRHYVRFPGTLLAPRSHESVTLDIAGGIPHWGKGENSWDCGMDGLFGIGGATVEAAVGNAVAAALRSRKSYGGPHRLPHPMTITEAEQHGRAEVAS
jgi:hypothetical protein